MKKCAKCCIEKTTDNFYKSKSNKNGLYYICKSCSSFIGKRNSRTIPGLITRMYSHQKSSSKVRGYNPPNYSKEEFKVWLLSQPNFNNLYEDWVKSDYSKNLIPSADRYDDYKPYTLDGIRLITWEENKRKGEKDRKKGVNRKTLKAVICIDKNGVVRDFHSMKEAERQTGVRQSGISQVCKGLAKYAGGYRWKLK